MDNIEFFQPTPLYKEYRILDLIERNNKITQRQMSNELGVAVSMVNVYLAEYEKKGYVHRKYYSSKVVEYQVTRLGGERRKLLNIWYLQTIQQFYVNAKDNIIRFLSLISKNGYTRILLYGAGEVAEIMMNIITNENSFHIEVGAIIDDDLSKIGKYLSISKIISIEEIDGYDYDGILISSYTHHTKIYEKLIKLGINKKTILHFFD